ncbi:hypothetical protein MHBO_001143 [Bonamia ostreae]|uniref:Uncharacterized protein n=1 Tax=Bonamia ostreae TaxID=126728 RepID=A0ABV2AHY0_9EUKA
MTKFMLKIASDLNMKLPDGNTFLNKTISLFENISILEAILDHPRILMNLPNSLGHTPINTAVIKMSCPIVELLIRKGAICDPFVNLSIDPLINLFSAPILSLKIMELLLKNNASICSLHENKTIFAIALEIQSLEVIEMLQKFNPPSKQIEFQRNFEALKQISKAKLEIANGNGRKNSEEKSEKLKKTTQKIELMKIFNPNVEKSGIFNDTDHNFVSIQFKKLSDYVLTNTRPLSVEEIFLSIKTFNKSAFQYLIKCKTDLMETFFNKNEKTVLLNETVKLAKNVDKQFQKDFCVFAITEMIENGANPNFKFEDKKSAIELAKEENLETILKILSNYLHDVKKDNGVESKVNDFDSNKMDQNCEIKLVIDENIKTDELEPLKIVNFEKTNYFLKEYSEKTKYYLKYSDNGESKKSVSKNFAKKDRKMSGKCSKKNGKLLFSKNESINYVHDYENSNKIVKNDRKPITNFAKKQSIRSQNEDGDKTAKNNQTQLKTTKNGDKTAKNNQIQLKTTESDQKLSKSMTDGIRLNQLEKSYASVLTKKKNFENLSKKFDSHNSGSTAPVTRSPTKNKFRVLKIPNTGFYELDIPSYYLTGDITEKDSFGLQRIVYPNTSFLFIEE